MLWLGQISLHLIADISILENAKMGTLQMRHRVVYQNKSHNYNIIMPIQNLTTHWSIAKCIAVSCNLNTYVDNMFSIGFLTNFSSTITIFIGLAQSLQYYNSWKIHARLARPVCKLCFTFQLSKTKNLNKQQWNIASQCCPVLSF